MVILVVKQGNRTEYYGPFRNADRAMQYERSFEGQRTVHTVPLTIPYSVVKQVLWRPDLVPRE